jgi:hypothetical protein
MDHTMYLAHTTNMTRQEKYVHNLFALEELLF